MGGGTYRSEQVLHLRNILVTSQVVCRYNWNLCERVKIRRRKESGVWIEVKIKKDTSVEMRTSSIPLNANKLRATQ